MKVDESERDEENIETNGQNIAGKSCMLSRFVTFRMQNLTNLAQIWLERFGKIQMKNRPLSPMSSEPNLLAQASSSNRNSLMGRY